MTIDRKPIDRVFGQKFSLSDQEKFANYLKDEVCNEKVKAVVEEQWMQFESDRETLPELDHVFYKLYYEIQSGAERSKVSRRLFLRISQVAAILLIGVLLGGSLFFFKTPPKITTESPIEFISQTGFRNRFKLPDGTTGWLGYGSRLKYHLDKDEKRVAELDGLAYFDVFHREKQPFIVETPGKVAIEVLGTKFNVSAYSSDNFCEVVLVQGKVKLNLDEQNVAEMVPNERILYNTANHTIEKSNVDVSDFVVWKDGKLILRDVSLEETCQKLSRYYNVVFDLQAVKSENHKVRLVLENESLEDALKLLAMIIPVKIQVEERKILEDNRYSKKKIIIKNL